MHSWDGSAGPPLPIFKPGLAERRKIATASRQGRSGAGWEQAQGRSRFRRRFRRPGAGTPGRGPEEGQLARQVQCRQEQAQATVP